MYPCTNAVEDTWSGAQQASGVDVACIGRSRKAPILSNDRLPVLSNDREPMLMIESLYINDRRLY
jgi:hypothetical protein